MYRQLRKAVTWKTGKPDEIVDTDGNLVGFTDAGWAEIIVKKHNESLEKEKESVHLDARYPLPDTPLLTATPA